MKQIAELFANDPSNMMESRKEVCVHLMMFVYQDHVILADSETTTRR